MAQKQRVYSFMFQVVVVLIFGFDTTSSERKVTEEFWKELLISVAKYIYCILLLRGSKRAFNFFYSGESSDILAVFNGRLFQAIVFSIATSILVQTDNILVGRQLAEVFIVHLLTDKTIKTMDGMEMFSEKSKDDKKTKLEAPSINYGTGMACSYFEGYLLQVLPDDGGENNGIENKIRAAEASMGVRFPVKRLFVIITKSMYCPPQLTEFNKDDSTLPHLETCQVGKQASGTREKSLEDIKRNVAGVINRMYRNSVYKLHRARGRPVCVVAECASPLNTLHKVLRNRDLYQTLSDIDVDAVVQDFCTTLKTILSRSIECRNKCELLYIDDTNPEENLASLILARVEELSPNFEQIIEQVD